MDIRKCWRLPPTHRPSDPHWTLMSRGTISRKVSFFTPAFYLLDGRFPTLQLSLWSLTCTTRLRTGSRMCVGHSETPQSFGRKGCKPGQRTCGDVIPGVAYIKVAPVSGCVRYRAFGLFFPK
ncbi:hypothetical protein TNIN_396061 [Trichonephila inaurata madagascariensis]|uniref:Uncharacterized protein n=1 Tax=Trichonephila inaurata madagascariensis TaxID=2747483 RepID=A0A8X6WYP6_9ARAC|nr:hypothetical protein TNIN_396061 [Trichonephila inaurata madagascariensis]